MDHKSVTTRQISGKGRGKWLGYPTINMTIPPDIDWKQGIYAAWVIIQSRRYMGALHYGAIPVFQDAQPSLEVFLIDTKDEDIPDTSDASIMIQPVLYLREVRNYPNTQLLVEQIGRDVSEARTALCTP